MKKQIIECVPNFSNGRDKSVIDNITNQIKLVDHWAREITYKKIKLFK